jgi:SAM-dependent methyltransferase
MRALDMGTGTGQVAALTADVVGPSGSVVGVDRSAEALAHARHRASANISYVNGDVTTFRPETPVDAVTCRLVLAYQRDPVEVSGTGRAAYDPAASCRRSSTTSAVPAPCLQYPCLLTRCGGSAAPSAPLGKGRDSVPSR